MQRSKPKGRGWITVDEAAARIERSKATIWRWARSDVITMINGYVKQSEILLMDRTMRRRIGRPKKNK